MSNGTSVIGDFLGDWVDDIVRASVGKIGRLKGNPYFVEDNSANGIKSENHIIYKVLNKEGGCMFRSEDVRQRWQYEFVVEYDKKDYDYGIYYGCKAIIDRDINDAEELFSILKEIFVFWNTKVRAVLTKNLELTFEENYSDRYKPTNNCNNNTFWPFWIRLGESADIETAAMAGILIKDAYMHCINNTASAPKVRKKTASKLSLPAPSPYTKQYEDWVEKEIGAAKVLFKDFLDKAVKEGVLEENYNGLECCWRFVSLTNVEAFFLLRHLFVEAKIAGYDRHLKLSEARIKEIESGQTIKKHYLKWEYVSGLFVTRSGGTFEHTRKSVATIISSVESEDEICSITNYEAAAGTLYDEKIK